MNTTITIATFYKFTAISQPWLVQSQLKEAGAALGIKGTILLAKEGINSTLAGPDAALQEMLAVIQAVPEIGAISYQLSWAEEMPFKRFFVKLKPEIVGMGTPEVNPAKRTGTYVSPEEWNALISDPDVLLIDTRNDYEVDIGTFKGAVNPHTAVFREFPDYVQRELDSHQHKKVAMFCTGGVRCEKASAWMLEQGFEQVYHLQGGILNYLSSVPADQSLWIGECFVFDDRIVI
ncbi:MAG: rhodanese-related sulfurtransferase [Legionellales bacterium]